MQKILLCILCVIMLSAFTACGSADDVKDEMPEDTPVRVIVTEQSDPETVKAEDSTEPAGAQSNLGDIMEDDFIVSVGSGSTDVDLAVYGNNVYQYLQDNGGYVSFSAKNTDGPITTYREIEVGKATVDDVLNAYGYATEYLVAEDSRPYQVLSNTETWAAGIIQNGCISYVAYDYLDDYQIIFYFDNGGQLTWLLYSAEPFELTYARDPEVVQYVQTTLNAMGYSCGTADGILGSNTLNAISDYIADNGLDLKPKITLELLQILESVESWG